MVSTSHDPSMNQNYKFSLLFSLSNHDEKLLMKGNAFKQRLFSPIRNHVSPENFQQQSSIIHYISWTMIAPLPSSLKRRQVPRPIRSGNKFSQVAFENLSDDVKHFKKCKFGYFGIALRKNEVCWFDTTKTFVAFCTFYRLTSVLAAQVIGLDRENKHLGTLWKWMKMYSERLLCSTLCTKCHCI